MVDALEPAIGPAAFALADGLRSKMRSMGRRGGRSRDAVEHPAAGGKAEPPISASGRWGYPESRRDATSLIMRDAEGSPEGDS